MPNPFLNTLTGLGQGAYKAITSLWTSALNGQNHSYVSEKDTEEDATTTQQYRTVVVYGEPLRPTKFLFVPEMNDFYTDEELNTVYHSADEYRYAVKKYGFIYKTQKFDNADTVQKLLEYSKDWIKNNYHGGITNFSITALDMHLSGNTDFEKLMTGKRVVVKYMDPVIRQKVSQTLTVISSEYDLQNPEKNAYKIGIPDITLNKVYGETSKSGGGGGGGGKPSDETDDETNTEVDGLTDGLEEVGNLLDEKAWAHFFTGANSTGDGGFSFDGLLTPSERDPTSDKTFAIGADALKSTMIKAVTAEASRVKSNYVTALNGVDTDTMSAKRSNTGDTNATKIDVVEKTTTKDLEATNDASVKKNLTVDEKTTTKDLEATNDASVKKNLTVSEKTTTKDLETSTLKLGNNTVNFKVQNGKPQFIINGTTYTLATQQ